MNLERHSKDIKKELPLKIFKKFSKMIENGATGFDLAFETEERQLTTQLMQYTEKYIFMEWLNKIITNQDKKDSILKDYAKYVESKEYKYKGYLLCKNCGAKITDKNQKFCEECGKELI